MFEDMELTRYVDIYYHTLLINSFIWLKRGWKLRSHALKNMNLHALLQNQ